MEISRVSCESRIQFRSKSIVAYNQFHYHSSSSSSSSSSEVLAFRASARHAANAAKLRNREKYTGQITKGAKKRLTKAVSLLVQSSSKEHKLNPVTGKYQYHQLSFITLTLPNVEAAKDAKYTHKNLLQPMLRILRNKYKMKSYVWKCELQKNGSIHYHLTTDLLLPWHHLRQHWNALLKKNGLIDAFVKEYGHDNPNSVDIHAVSKLNDLEAYLIKYISKEYQNEVALSGKVWDCSRNLKASDYFTTSLTYDLHAVINKELDLGWVKPLYTDHCVILKSSTTDYYLSFDQNLINQYYTHLKSIREWESKEPTKSSSTTGQLKGGSNISQSVGIISPTPPKAESGRIYRQSLINWNLFPSVKSSR